MSEGVAQFLDAISLHLRYGHFAEGIIRLSDLAYFAGIVAVSAAVTRLAFELRRTGA